MFVASVHTRIPMSDIVWSLLFLMYAYKCIYFVCVYIGWGNITRVRLRKVGIIIFELYVTTPRVDDDIQVMESGKV